MAVLNRLENNDERQVLIQRCDEAEMDEMWSFVGNKSNQRWLWHAIDHHTGKYSPMSWDDAKIMSSSNSSYY